MIPSLRYCCVHMSQYPDCKYVELVLRTCHVNELPDVWGMFTYTSEKGTDSQLSVLCNTLVVRCRLLLLHLLPLPTCQNDTYDTTCIINSSIIGSYRVEG